MDNHFSRPALASEMAHQLIHPGVLNESLRSGLFLSGQRRTGKTTFLLMDFIPALEQERALAIYVDLWTDIKANPAQLVKRAIATALADLQTPGSDMLKRLGRVTGMDVGAFGFKFGFKLDSIGQPDGVSLAEALTQLVDQAKCDVVLIVDEVQQAMTTDEGNDMLFGLKAARDAVNIRPNTPGKFIFVGTGSHRAMVSEMTTRRLQAFAGAASVPYPVLDEDYVGFILNRLNAEKVPNLPSMEALVAAFRMLGNRPEELLRALRNLQTSLKVSNTSPDETLAVVAATMRTSIADIELAKVDQLGALAQSIFNKIAFSDGDARWLFSVDAAAEYSIAIGREVKIEEIQPIVIELVESNLIMRQGHGRYSVSDPFVQTSWRERKLLLSNTTAAGPNAGTAPMP
jgi:hypothetical protein